MEWFELPGDLHVRPGVARIATAKAGLIALTMDQVPQGDWARKGIFPANGVIVRNLLLVQLCHGGRAEEGRAILLATSKDQGGPIVVVGRLADPGTTYRAYGLWLAASPFRADPPPVAELIGELRVLNELFSGNDALARGAASICVAACPPRAVSAARNNGSRTPALKSSQAFPRRAGKRSSNFALPGISSSKVSGRYPPSLSCRLMVSAKPS